MSANLPDLPAPDPVVPCCDTAAYSDGERCTCWTPVLEPEPSMLRREGPSMIRPLMCGDCAYRPDSPEDGNPDVPPGRPFFCHDGMPRAVAYTHPLLPEPVPVPWTGDYQPDVTTDRCWQADGQPGVLCAGWAAFTRARHRDVLARPDHGRPSSPNGDDA